MNMDQSAVFLASSILIALGFLIIIGAIIVVNNLLNKYWKPVKIFTADSWNLNPPDRFITPEELNRQMPELNNASPQHDPISGEPMKEINNKEKVK